MANLGIQFDASEVPAREDYTPIPNGTYVGMIVNSAMKENSKHDGEFLELSIDIMDGEYVGKKLTERLNIRNQNETAVKIAYQTLKEICEAVGMPKISDSNQLHNKRFLLDVVVEQGKDYMKDGVQVTGKPQNKVKKYKPYAGGASAVTAAASGGKKPWA